MISFEINEAATPIELVSKRQFEDWLTKQPAHVATIAERHKFSGNIGRFFEITNESGELEKVVAGLGFNPSHMTIGNLPSAMTAGEYRLENPPSEHLYELALGWGLSTYRFNRYKQSNASPPRTLHVDSSVSSVNDEIQAISLCRDLINTPTSDMLPQHLEAETRKVSTRHQAEIKVVMDKELLKEGFRTIYTVGQASNSEPRLIDLRWGEEDDPKVTIVGKGVCFDSGGLNIKTANSMRLMKKDMGGAAHALALADLIMRRRLPVRLRLLIPAVENAISGNAYRPGDVIETYKGLTVEIGNTDAEGRLILCDALALACEESPDLIIDYATLTGAARTAVGTDIAAMFANNDDVAQGIEQAGADLRDPICRLPLFQGYRRGLRSPVADLCNIANFNEAGAIVAALFLESFISDTDWVHFDIMAYNNRARPAHPVGGDAMALRATYRYLEQRYQA